MRKSNRNFMILTILILTTLAAIVRFWGIDTFFAEGDGTGWINTLFYANRPWVGANWVSSDWTYAPGQYFITFFTFGFIHSWTGLMIATRAFSAITSLIGSALLLGLIFQITGLNESRKNVGTWLLSLSAWIVFNIVYLLRAQSGTPYAVSACIVTALISLLWQFLKSEDEASERWYIIAVIFSIVGCWFNYQIIVFSAITLSLSSLFLFKDWRKSLERTSSLMATLVVCGLAAGLNAALLWRTYISGFLASHMNQPKWKLVNMGFPNYENLSLWGKIAYTPEYFLHSWWENVAFNLAPTPYLGSGKDYATILGSVYFGFWLIGLFGPLFSTLFRSKRERAFFFILSLTVFFYYVLNLLKIVPVGGSRHGHHLIPLITLQCILGLRILLDLSKQRSSYLEIFSERACQLIFLVHCLVFFVFFPSFLKDTREQMPMTDLVNKMLNDDSLVGIIGFGGNLAGSAAMGIPAVAKKWEASGKWMVKDVTWGGFEKVSEPLSKASPGQRAIVFGTTAMGDPSPYFKDKLAASGIAADFKIISKGTARGSDEAFNEHSDNGYWLMEIVRK